MRLALGDLASRCGIRLCVILVDPVVKAASSPSRRSLRVNRRTPKRLWSGAGEAAAGFYGGAAFSALRTVFRLVGRDGEPEQGLGFDGKFDFAAAAVDERANGNDAAAGFFNDLDGVERGAAGGPDVFDHQHFFTGFEREAAPQTQTAAGVALDENGGDAGFDADILAVEAPEPLPAR